MDSKCLILLMLIFLKTTLASSDVTINPGCKSSKSSKSTVNCTATPYLIRVINSADTNNQIQHLVGAYKSPSVITLTSEGANNVTASWGNHGITDLRMTHPDLLTNVVGVAFTELVLTNSTQDALLFTPTAERYHVPLDKFHWDMAVERHHHTITFTATSYTDGTPFNDTSIVLEVFTPPTQVRAADNPHLLVAESAVQVSVTVKDLQNLNFNKLLDVSDNFTNMRLGINMAMYNHKGKEFNLTTTKTIDDEFCPGVFQMNTVSAGGESYLQYRYVVYQSSDRLVMNSVVPHLSRPGLSSKDTDPTDVSDDDRFGRLNVTDEVKDSLLYKLLAKNLTGTGEATLLSLGDPTYSLFVFTLGTGSPPAESMTGGMMAAMGVGIGLPVVSLAGAVVGYFIIRRQNQGRQDSLLAAH